MYALSKDPLKVRKSVIVLLNLSCGLLLLYEYLFYIFKGSLTPLTITVMYIVNAAVYYLIVLMLLFYAMLVYSRLFNRFDFKPDMPYRRRLIAVCAIVVFGLILITVSSLPASTTLSTAAMFTREPVLLAFGSHSHGRDPDSRFGHFGKQAEAYVTSTSGPDLLCHPPDCRRGHPALFLRKFSDEYLHGFSVLLMFFENIVNKERDLVMATKTEVRT